MITLAALLLLLISILLLAILAFAYQWIGFVTGLLIIGAFVIFLSMYLRTGIILLNEMEVGVIFSRRNENFAYFIDSDVTERTNRINNYDHKTINAFIHRAEPYHHFINPFTEKMEDKIKRNAYKGADTTKVRTKEGITVEIDWSVSFRLDVTQIKPGIEHKMARALPQNAGNMIKGKATHALRHIIEQTSIIDLYEEDAAKTLEEKLRLAVIDKVSFFGVIGINPNNQVQIKSIEMPRNIENALKVAHQRKLQTETVTHALESLKNSIKDFNDTDMARLAELEKLRIVDEKSAGLVYMMDSVVNKNVNKQVHHQKANGNGNSNN